jgi:hypothetical protein
MMTLPVKAPGLLKITIDAPAGFMVLTVDGSEPGFSVNARRRIVLGKRIFGAM